MCRHHRVNPLAVARERLMARISAMELPSFTIADPAHVSDPVTDGRGLILAFGIATIVVTLLWLAAARVTPLIAGRIKRFGVWDDPHQDAHLIGSDVVRYQIHGDDHV